MAGSWQGRLSDALSNFSLTTALELLTAIHRAEEEGHELTVIEEVLRWRMISKIEEARKTSTR